MGCGQSQFSLIYPKKFKRKDNKNKGKCFFFAFFLLPNVTYFR